MHYVSLSFTHKNTDIALREKLAFSSDEKKREILRLIGSSSNISESMVLSTCNRVEILVVCKKTKDAIKHILNSISILTLVNSDALELRADIYEDDGAIHHLFAVASSLDSLVIGETQIAGQLKSAFKFAYDNADCGDKISFAIHFAFKIAAKVRTLTQISKNPVSVSGVAVAKAKEIFENLGGMTAVVIGAGEMSRLACKHLIDAQVNVIILNRNKQKAKNLCDELGELASYDSFDKISEYINRYRLIFSATAADEPIITNLMIEPKDFDRCFFDIAVPRDIDVKQSSNLFVFSVDDLKQCIQTNLALREEQASLAYSIVAKGVEDFYHALTRYASTPAIKALRFHAKDLAEKEIHKAIKKGYIRHCDKDEARKLIHQVLKAFLHNPSVKLKDLDDDKVSETLAYLFDIEINKEKEEIQ